MYVRIKHSLIRTRVSRAEGLHFSAFHYFEVLHLYKLPASAYFIRYKVRGGAFDLAVEVTQIYI